MLFRLYFNFVLILFFTIPVVGQVIVYDGPSSIMPSDRYSLTIEQNDSVYHSFVYLTTSPGTYNAPPGHTTSFTNFSFSGSIKITVTRLDGNNISNCIIRPKSYEITPEIDGASVSFIIDEPRKVSVEFDQDLRHINVDGKSLPVVKHSMLVFADTIERDVPDSTNSDVIYFEPGVHNIGRNYRIPNGKTVYVAGGAYLIGNVYNENSYNITLKGRGIISGEDHTEIRKYHLVDFRSSTNINISGVTLIETPNYNLVMGGSNHHVKNVKMISWYGQTDGVDAAKNSIVEDCFLKVNDDAIKLYHSNSVVRRNTIWIQRTGAPFQFTWNMGGEIENVHVYDNDVIHTDWEVEHLNRGIFSSIGGGDAHLHNWYIEDIRVEGHAWRMLYLHMKKTVWSPQPDYGEIDHIYFNNIQVEGPVIYPSIIKGVTDSFGPKKIHYYHDIFIDSMMVAGECMTESDFQIDDNTTYNIQIGCGSFPPLIKFNKPSNGSVFELGSDIDVDVSADVYKGKIKDVTLFVNDDMISTLTELPFIWGSSYGDSLLSKLHPGYYEFKIIATDTLKVSVEKSISITVTGDMPEGWGNVDIGNPQLKGNSFSTDTAMVIISASKGITGFSDQFHFMYQQKGGDAEIIGHLKSFNGSNEWAKVGLMIRESLDAGSKHAFIALTNSNGSIFGNRTVTDLFSGQVTPQNGETAPLWLKLNRTDNKFAGYTSSDGLTWELIAEKEILMQHNIYFGLALSSNDDSNIALAEFDSITVSGGLVGVVSEDDNLPEEYKLKQNYPNPFNPITKIKFSIKQEGRVNLSVYNILGEKVTQLVDENLKAGNYFTEFDGLDLASGIYFYRLETADFIETKKMILLR